MKRSICQRPATLAVASLLLTLVVSSLQAQPIYRSVGSDGRVTFSDKPLAINDKATALGADGRNENPPASELPYELRQTVSRYPVTLYSADNCSPCDSGRALLSSRGIPFTERTVNTPQDADTLQKLSGETALPLLTIGGQNLQGYIESEWTQYLDAAGYPKTSQLPPAYRRSPAMPLVPPPKPIPAETTRPEAAREAPPSPRTPAVNPDNPAGITF